MTDVERHWFQVITTIGLAGSTVSLVFWIALICICVSFYRTFGFRSLRWLGAYCGIATLAVIAGMIARMLNHPFRFSPIYTAVTMAQIIIPPVAHILIAAMILSEIAVLLNQTRVEINLRLIDFLLRINRRIEPCGLILVSLAAISLGLSIAWIFEI